MTRPEPGATRTAERVEVLGFLPLILPLTKIVPLQIAPPDGPFDAVAITSANALRHAPKDFLTPLLELPCFVVGQTTAEAARHAGFKHVTVGNGDGVSLAHRLNVSVQTTARVIYLTGQVRSPEFEHIVQQTGRQIHPVLTYDTLFADYADAYLVNLFNGRAPDICLLFSRKSAQVFLNLTKRNEIAHLFENTEIICLSKSISEVLNAAGSGAVRVADRPDEAAMLAMLGA